MYKTLYYPCTKLASFRLYGSRNVISTKPYFQREEITTNFSYEIQNPRHYFQHEYEIQNLKHYFQCEEITKFQLQNSKS